MEKLLTWEGRKVLLQGCFLAGFMWILFPLPAEQVLLGDDPLSLPSP